jgi:hypothetical protein
VQNAEYVYICLDFTDSYEWEGRRLISCVLDPTRSATIWKFGKSSNAFEDYRGDTAGTVRTCLMKS